MYTLYDCVQARPRMQQMSVIASFQKCPRGGMVRVRIRLMGRIGSGAHVGWCRLVSWIGLGPCLMGRVWSKVRVSYSFHI